MRTSSILVAGASLLSFASARITGFSVPETVAPDSTVKLNIIGVDDIQSSQDVAISFGFSQSAYPDSLGQLLSSKYLGPDDSNFVGNITHFVHIPSSAPYGSVTFSAALFSLIGAEYSPNTGFFTANITVGSSSSGTYVTSTPSN